MNRLLLTGDTHGSLDINKLSYKNFPLAREFDKNDYVCILGDFGCVWNLDNEDNYWLDFLEDKNFTTLFLPGNHECYPLLRSFPEEQWCGGTIRRIRPSVIMLERGEIFNIANKIFFCMGGARSVDRAYRKEGISWWPDEMPVQYEYERAANNLENKLKNANYSSLFLMLRKNKFDYENFCRTEYIDYDNWYKEYIESRKGHLVSEETKEKIRQAHLGKTLTEEHKRKIGLSLIGRESPTKGRKASEETKQKQRESMIGKNAGEKNGMYGKHHTEEAKKK